LQGLHDVQAFAVVREAIAWLDRTLPLSARLPKGAINREDRLSVPAEARREIRRRCGPRPCARAS
jgi:hypothetical protein